MNASISPTLALAWVFTLSVGPFASVAYAHAENMGIAFALCGGLFQTLCALGLCLVKGAMREKVRAIGAFAALIAIALLVLFLGPTDGRLIEAGLVMYALATFIGPVAAYIWISDHRL